MSRLQTIARLFLGLIFLGGGLAGLLASPEASEDMPEGANALMSALVGSGYLWQMIKGTEIVAGLMLLSGRWAPLALTVSAPITLNILAFHVFLAPAGVVIGLALLAVHLFVAYGYRSSFSTLLDGKSQPG